MIATIKAMILDFHEQDLNPGVLRNLEVKVVPGKATVCIGVRRCGKSTLLYQLMQQLEKKGVSRQNILYINFFDDRLHELRHDGLNAIIETYFSLFPEKKNTEKVYCFFDEIQVVPGWESFIDRIIRTEKCQVYITGSSAHMLSKEIATQMRGRALTWELFPFSFREFLSYRKIDGDNPMSTKRRLLVQKVFESFWETGAFPEVAALEKPLRVKTHQEYFTTVLFRDIIERHDISHPRAITELAYWLVDHAASLYSVNNLTGYLKSLGYNAPKSSVSDYLKWFEDAYFLFTVRLFDASRTRSNSNPKKIYCIDHSMAASVSSGILLNSGHLLENMVFTALRRLSAEIFYYKTKNGREVDFIVQTQDRSRMLVQVCESLDNDRTRKREVSALNEAMDELDLNFATIVTRNSEETILVDKKTIAVVPIWRFLLEVDAQKEL